ncbi:hypothetical protein N8500_08680 [Candidatus Puniceispirillum sp.]|nr:hypothetical protein [Candidatus Puniceispirillum sp.]
MYIKYFFVLMHLLFFTNIAFGDERIKSITLGGMELDRAKFHLIDANLDRIKSSNFNSITLIVDWYVNTHRDPKILPRYPGEPFPDTNWFKPTLTHEEIIEISKKARSRGLDVILKMHIEPLDWPFGGQGRYAIKPSKVLWDHYENFAIDTAKIANKINAKLLFLGTETDHLTTNPAKWKQIIKSVKKYYSGPLSYAASFNGKPNFSASQWSPPDNCGPCKTKIWGEFDFIGFEPYAALTSKTDPSLDEMKRGVRRIIDLVMLPLSKKYNKKLIIPEIAFMSFDGVNTNPISLHTSKYKVEDMPPDHEEQAMAYQAWLEVLNEQKYKSLVYGIILWPGFLREPSEDMQSWIQQEKWDLIWGKKAEKTIRNAFNDWN